MKYNKIAAIISTLMLASTAAHAAEIYNKDGNKLDLYGKVTGLHYFSDDKGSDGDKTYVRMGFKGETQINDLMTGYGQWEYEFSGNKTEDQGTTGSKTRVAFAGLKFNEYGSFDYGRNYGVAYDIGAWTDMLPEFGGDTWTQTDVFMTGRTSGVATYRNNNFFGLVDGLNFALQYQGKNENRDVNKQNGDGYGISANYNYEGFGIGGSYTTADRTDEQTSQTTAHGDKADTWNVGLKYDANNIYLAAVYAETRNMTNYGNQSTNIADKTQNYELVAQYQFDNGLRPSVSYLKSRGKDLNGYGDQDLVEYVEVGASYYFNKNMATYVDYKINLIDDNSFTKSNGIATDNIVAVGLTYQF
ncbi:phosphoporin PhoE [Salmonella enterica subsp. enterica serovar Choleraesuis]|nr:phosphoporin PhoE [Salmonella enterica subsp. enterica serovar Choleraesuis]